MKYAVVYNKNKDKKATGRAVSRQEAVFYNLDDATKWEKHINMTIHVKTNIVPIFGDT